MKIEIRESYNLVKSKLMASGENNKILTLNYKKTPRRGRGENDHEEEYIGDR